MKINNIFLLTFWVEYDGANDIKVFYTEEQAKKHLEKNYPDYRFIKRETDGNLYYDGPSDKSAYIEKKEILEE